MSTFAQAAAALREASTELRAATSRSVTEATALVTAAVRAGRGRAGGASGRLRGVGSAGAPIGERGSVRGRTGLVRATGPAHLLDHPTRAHTITARRGGLLRTPFGPRPSVEHPGTIGTPYFEDAVEQVSPLLPAIFERNAAQTLRRL